MSIQQKMMNYKTLADLNTSISSPRDVEDVALQVVHSLTQILGLKGCALMLWDRGSDELQVAASVGLSEEYLNKGPINARKSIAESLVDGPVAIYDVNDDPRIQYPEEAMAEGIRSIMSVPLLLRGRTYGVMRMYTAEPWDFSDQDLLFCQAVAEIVSLTLDNVRMYRGLKMSIDALKVMRPSTKPTKRTLYE